MGNTRRGHGGVRSGARTLAAALLVSMLVCCGAGEDGARQGGGGIEDVDRDGVADGTDNCVYDRNAEQADGDGDGVGDACDGCPADPADGCLRTLRVEGGWGAGSHPADATVHIGAAPALPGRIFAGWRGLPEGCSDPRSPHAWFRMPGAALTVTAAFRSRKAWNPVTRTIRDVAVTSHIPAGHKALILLFHGMGGAGTFWFREKEEKRAFVERAVDRGYGVVALDSTNRLLKAWNDEGSFLWNPDIRNVQGIVTDLAWKGETAWDVPLFGVGMSDGGTFTSRVAPVLGFRAAALFCAPGARDVMEETGVPTFWCLAPHDSVIHTPSAERNHETLQARGVPTALWRSVPSPVQPLRFQRMTGVDADLSASIHEGLRRGGFLDSRHFLHDNPLASGWEAVTEGAFGSLERGIREQLLVCYGGHQFCSDLGDRVLDLFDRHLP